MYPPDTFPQDIYPLVTYRLDTYPMDRYHLGHIPPNFEMPHLVHASCVGYILCFKFVVVVAGIAFICDAGAIKLSDICSVRKG